MVNTGDFESPTPGSSPGGSLIYMRETHKTVHLKRLPEQAYKSFPLLAQSVEQWTVVPMVTSSILVERTHSSVAQLVERQAVNL